MQPSRLMLFLGEFGRTSLPVDSKADASPVTEADRQAEAAMRELIRASFPAHAIFGEEGGMQAGDPAEDGAGGGSSFLWVLDPIDGTKSFITGASWPLHAKEQACILHALAFSGDLLQHHNPHPFARAVKSQWQSMGSPGKLHLARTQFRCHHMICDREARVWDAHSAAAGRHACPGHHQPADHQGALGGRGRPADHPQWWGSSSVPKQLHAALG